MLRKPTFLLPFSLLLLLIAVWPAPARAAVSVSFGVFYSSLSPYGDWNHHDRFGWVWSPYVSTGWRPYTDGDWVFVADHGWTWFGDEPWAWAPYHYGRWAFDPVLGWIWIPGYEWAPAYVDWVAYDDWIGWAPLPPRLFWTTWIVRPRISAAHYCFVDRRFLGGPALSRHILPVSRNPDLFRVSRRVRAVDVAPIVRASGRRIEPLRLRDVSSPQAARVAVERGEARLFRPRIERSGRGQPPAAIREAARLDRRQGDERRSLGRRSAERSVREPQTGLRGRDRVSIDRSERGRARERATDRRVERRQDLRRSAPRRVHQRETLPRTRVRSVARERSRPSAQLSRTRGRELRMDRQPRSMRQSTARAPQPPRRQGRGRGRP